MADLTKNTRIRWLTFNKILILVLLLVAFFGYMDSVNLQGVFALDAQYQADHGWSDTNNIWNIYWQNIQPMFNTLWLGIIATIALFWYIITKDKSEALALFITPALLIIFGVQDLIYFLFSPQRMDVISCWADGLTPVKIISDLMKEKCPTQISFFTSAAIGTILSWFSLFKLKYYQPRKKKR